MRAERTKLDSEYADIINANIDVVVRTTHEVFNRWILAQRGECIVVGLHIIGGGGECRIGTIPRMSGGGIVIATGGTFQNIPSNKFMRRWNLFSRSCEGIKIKMVEMGAFRGTANACESGDRE